MKSRAVLYLACVLANILPAAAQSCNDDIAGLSVNDDGKYVMEGPAAQNSAHAAANMSNPPQVPANMNMSLRTDAPLPAPPAGTVNARQAEPLPVTPKPEEAAAKAGADQEKAAPPSSPGAALPAPVAEAAPDAAPPAPRIVAQAATDTAPAQPTAGTASTSPRTASAAKPRRRKKTSGQPARKSGAAIVKEGGKTCSGLDEYRVCW